jgi:dihydroorotase
MQADSLIRGGRVIDPSQGIDRQMDVAILDGCIAALEEALPADGARQMLDATGKLVVPGLIDLHAHVAADLISLAVEPDDAGVNTGVTTVVDAGSTGRTNLHAFRKFIVSQARTDVFVFLNIAPFGEAVLPEVGFEVADEDEVLRTIAANRDVVRGIKVRAIGELMYATKVDVIGLAVRVARRAGLPLMVHLGMGFAEPVGQAEIDAFIARLLGMLESGDVLTHAFTDKPGGVFHPDGTPVPGLEKALGRGVLLDAAPGRGHLSFKLAGAALGRGFVPHALGTDVVKLADEQPHFYNVAAVASKFMALGMTLADAIAAVTVTPARILGESDRRGSLKVGMPADITVLTLHEGDFLLHDGRAGNMISGQAFLSPARVVKNGAMHDVRPGLAAHVPRREVVLEMLRQATQGQPPQRQQDRAERSPA